MKTSIPYLLFLTLLLACNSHRQEKNISRIDLELEILRLEMDLFTASPDNMEGTIQKVSSKYGDFLSLFNQVINIGETTSPAYQEYLNAFVTDKINFEVYEATVTEYPDLSAFEKDLTRAFKHYRYYFPEKEIPALYNFVSRFNSSSQ